MRRTFPKLFFFDLDGTLLAPGSMLTERTLSALRRAIARGAQLALATGGFSFRALQLARMIDDGRGATWTITHNGATLWDPKQRLVSATTMPAEALRRVLDATGPRVWCVYEELTGETGTAVYYAGRHRHGLHHFVWGPQPPAVAPDARRELFPPSGRRRSLRRGELDAVVGAWLIGTPAALRELDASVQQGELLGARYLHWSQRLGQILGNPRLHIVGRDIGPLGTSKGTAAKVLCERLKIPHSATVAFGDADNDLELLELAGTAVAMENATSRVKEVATILAPPNTEDGVAAILERWL